MSVQRFTFAVEMSQEFLAVDPVLAQRWLDAHREQIAKQQYATGPRGGTYRLITPPDDWRVNIDPFWRPTPVLYVTKRYGRYVRPGRVMHPSEAGTSGTFMVPVKDGRAMLPDGTTIETPSRFVSVPVPPPPPRPRPRPSRPPRVPRRSSPSRSASPASRPSPSPSRSRS